MKTALFLSSLLVATAITVMLNYLFVSSYLHKSVLAVSKANESEPVAVVKYCTREELRKLQDQVTEYKTDMIARLDTLNTREALKRPASDIASVDKNQSAITSTKNYTASENTPAIREESMLTLDEKMLAQPENPNWETQTKDEISDFFAQRGDTSLMLEDAYCSGDICRLEISYTDAEQLDSLFVGARAIVSWPHKGQSFRLDRSGDRQRQAIYLQSLQALDEG